MDKKIPPQLKQQIITFYNEIWDALANQHAADYNELLAFWHDFHRIHLETAMTNLERFAQKYEISKEHPACLDKIEADSIIVEITDKNTGKVFRRNLPVKYLETDNGLVLSGETIEGNPSKIAFFSEAALGKMQNLFGKGPDSPRCHD